MGYETRDWSDHDYRQELYESEIPQPHGGFISTMRTKGIAPGTVADVLHAWRYWTRAQSLEDQRNSPIPPMSDEELRNRMASMPDFYQYASNEPHFHGVAQREAEAAIDQHDSHRKRVAWLVFVVLMGLMVFVLVT